MAPLRDLLRLRRLGLLALLGIAPVACQFGGSGYAPPAPHCDRFKCSKGQKPAGNSSHKLWSYGCKDSGINFLSMGSFDPNNPLGGMNQGKNVDKCCVERDICKQTCGTTSETCHDNFQKCSKKICKGDQNCDLAAMMADMTGEPLSDEEEKEKKEVPPGHDKFDYEKDKKKRDCRGYEKGQNAACMCVPEEDWKIVTESNLKAFYATHNPEKLDDAGNIKDLADVWKKWTGKEAEMFQALATKYKKKAVEIKIKPKPPAPPPYTPPPPLSPEEQEKEDKRKEEQKAKWAEEDRKLEEERKEKEERKREEAEERKRQKEEGDEETVEL